MERVKNNKISIFLELLKGTLFSLIISMLLIIVFAIIIRFANISDSLILPINQVIKGVSLLLGTIIALKGSNKGIVKGFLIGIFYSIFSYIIFSILSSSLTFGLTSLTDLVFNGIIGAISGLIAVNIKK